MGNGVAGSAARRLIDTDMPRRDAYPSWLEFSEAVERYLGEHAASGHTTLEEFLQREIGDLLGFIQKAKQDIAAIEPNKIRSKDIPGAHNELDAVVAATEEATGKILDAAEDIETLATASEGETADRLTDIATKIYEASNFQDITGQRISKVVAILVQIEAKVAELARAFGDEGAVEIDPTVPVRIDRDGVELHGPQSAGEATEQDEIDRLMAEMEANAGEATSQDDIDKLFD
jgi:chemotaxis protein CheZ